MVDLLLIQPPIRDFYLTAKRTIPYGLASVAAAVEAEGFRVALLDALATSRSRPRATPTGLRHLDGYYGPPDRSPFGLFSGYRHYGYSFQHLEKEIAALRPRVVGISSLFTPYEAEAMETAARVRSLLPDCPIVMGGHHPTHLPKRVLACPSVDYVVRGEGEAALPALMRALRDGSDPAAVPGLCFRRPDGGLHIANPAFVRDPGALPLPAGRLVAGGYYRRRGRRSCVVVTGRGCPMRCSYCCMAGNAAVPYRKRPLGAVFREIDAAAREGDLGFLDFEDENLAFDRPWFLDLLHGLADRFPDGSVELRAMNGLYPPSLDGEVIPAMAAAGFRTLNLSLGSASPEQLARFRRPNVVPAFQRCLVEAASVGLDCVGYVIAGAPYQRPETSVDDLLFLASRRTLAGLSVFYPAPGSRDFTLCERTGLLPDTPEQMRSSALPVSHLTSRLSSATLLRLARILNFMKRLADEGIALPAARDVAAAAGGIPQDRRDIGRVLLSGFFHDGRIRGVHPDGRLFEHRAELRLTGRFLSGLRRSGIRGARGTCKAPLQLPHPIQPGDPKADIGGIAGH
jgi:hypothetical protein